MNSPTYTLKISPQGQLTLPKELREKLHVQAGSRISVTVADDGNLRISRDLSISKHFGKLAGAWTDSGQDAAVYVRDLRDIMQPKQD
jgi:AbrB family looped-hinge helix DNA binding protein